MTSTAARGWRRKRVNVPWTHLAARVRPSRHAMCAWRQGWRLRARRCATPGTRDLPVLARCITPASPAAPQATCTDGNSPARMRVCARLWACACSLASLCAVWTCSRGRVHARVHVLVRVRACVRAQVFVAVHVRMCVCVCDRVCAFVCERECACACARACKCACEYECACAREPVSASADVRLRTRVRVHLRVQVRVRQRARVSVPMRLRVCVHMCICACVHARVCVRIHVRVRVHAWPACAIGFLASAASVPRHGGRGGRELRAREPTVERSSGWPWQGTAALRCREHTHAGARE